MEATTIGMKEALIIECKKKLLEAKSEILNRVKSSRNEFASLDKSGGDEADQTMSVLQENEYLSAQERMRFQLVEIEFALARIERGVYGICEETDEPIELERLRALPWTRVSIEGAEIREALNKRFAR
jgi:DnaK suppressor protein